MTSGINGSRRDVRERHDHRHRTIDGQKLRPETLKLRMTSSMKNARYVAEFLQEHPKIRTVHYLGFLTECEQHDVYRRQSRAPGSTSVRDRRR